MSEIGNNIYELRTRAMMSQDDLARLIGKTRSAVSQYESGDITPRMGVIEDMARIFGVSKADIIGESARFSGLLPDERELMRYYRSVEPWERELIISHAKMVFEHSKGEKNED